MMKPRPPESVATDSGGLGTEDARVLPKKEAVRYNCMLARGDLFVRCGVETKHGPRI
jgi:hypothetical protein